MLNFLILTIGLVVFIALLLVIVAIAQHAKNPGWIDGE